MARLPIVGGDTGTWGTVLNEYLEVSHNADGTQKVSEQGGGEYNVLNYGAVLDGVTDDSGAIQDTIDACHTAGGGIVVIPGRSGTAGVVVNSTLELTTGVWLKGLGSSTALIGTANPVIAIKQDVAHDRMAISDLTIQNTVGEGIWLETSGGFQLGWPRITVENVTIADAGQHAFIMPPSGVIETRFINCVSLRAGGRGFWLDGTDLFLIGCTAADSVNSGFYIGGANNKLAACKAYANNEDGFQLVGAGRHMLVACESQDNSRYGFAVQGQWNTIAGCLADTDNLAGVFISGKHNVVQGSFMYGGGGSGQVTAAGVYFYYPDALYNVVTGVSNCPAPVGGEAQGNQAEVNTASGAYAPVTYGTPWTPDAYLSQTQTVTLTGNLTLVAPTAKHTGQLLTFAFLQDGVGGRTVTFPSQFKTNWTPVTTANKMNVITFQFDGTSWQQISAAVGVTQ